MLFEEISNKISGLTKPFFSRFFIRPQTRFETGIIGCPTNFLMQGLSLTKLQEEKYNHYVQSFTSWSKPFSKPTTDSTTLLQLNKSFLLILLSNKKKTDCCWIEITSGESIMLFFFFYQWKKILLKEKIHGLSHEKRESTKGYNGRTQKKRQKKSCHSSTNLFKKKKRLPNWREIPCSVIKHPSIPFLPNGPKESVETKDPNLPRRHARW